MIKKTDIVKILTMIRINFENAYKCNTVKEDQLLVETWHDILKPYPRDVVMVAVKNALRSAKFAPRIGDIVEQIEKMQKAYEKDENELWAELRETFREVRKCAYRFQFTMREDNGLTQGENARRRVEDIFAKLSPELREYVHNVAGLINLAHYGDDELSYERGRFMRIMPQLQERIKARKQMPENIALLIQSIVEQVSVGSCDTPLLKGE